MIGKNGHCKHLEVYYERIKEEIYGIKFSESSIASLVQRFSVCINSRRKESSIKDIVDLISVLEERCVLDCTNISALFVVEEETVSDVLKTLISCHLKLVRSWSEKEAADSEPSETYSSFPVHIPSTVLEKLEDVGRRWQDFARYLGVSESHILSISRFHCEDKDKIREIIEIFIRDAEIFTYKDKILKALRKIGRNDLKEDVSQIFCQV